MLDLILTDHERFNIDQLSQVTASLPLLFCFIDYDRYSFSDIFGVDQLVPNEFKDEFFRIFI